MLSILEEVTSNHTEKTTLQKQRIQERVQKRQLVENKQQQKEKAKKAKLEEMKVTLLAQEREKRKKRKQAKRKQNDKDKSTLEHLATKQKTKTVSFMQ